MRSTVSHIRWCWPPAPTPTVSQGRRRGHDRGRGLRPHGGGGRPLQQRRRGALAARGGPEPPPLPRQRRLRRRRAIAGGSAGPPLATRARARCVGGGGRPRHVGVGRGLVPDTECLDWEAPGGRHFSRRWSFGAGRPGVAPQSGGSSGRSAPKLALRPRVCTKIDARDRLGTLRIGFPAEQMRW